MASRKNIAPISLCLIIIACVVYYAVVLPGEFRRFQGPFFWLDRNKAKTGPPLAFPSTAGLKSAEVRPWQSEAAWKPLDLEPAKALVDALSDNYKFIRQKNKGREPFRPTHWEFRFKWEDGTEILVALTEDGDVIQRSEKTVNGVAAGSNNETFIVATLGMKDRVERCVRTGEPPAPDQKQPDAQAPK